jgi:hypothetical protein
MNNGIIFGCFDFIKLLVNGINIRQWHNLNGFEKKLVISVILCSAAIGIYEIWEFLYLKIFKFF